MTDKPGVLRVFFRGLCVFYYQQPKDQGLDEVKEIKVLLPDARIPEKCYPYKYDVEDPLFPHTPLLSIPKALLDPLPSKKPHKFIIEDEFVFPLKNHVIEINSQQNGPPLDMEDDFAKFIPNLANYACDGKKPIPINKDLLDPKENKLDKKLIAFLKIDKGVISIPPHQNTESRRAADYIKTVFEKAGGSTKNKIVTVANCVCWETKVKFVPKPPLNDRLNTIKASKDFPDQAEILGKISSKLANFKENSLSTDSKDLIKELGENYIVKEKSPLYKQLEDEYLNLDPKNFQERFEEIFLSEATNMNVDEAENIAQSISSKLFTHDYFPFTINLHDGEKKLSLNLQLKPKIKKEKGKEIIIDAIPGNIYITNMPLDNVSMHPPFQRERDLDFALTHSVLDLSKINTKKNSDDLILPRRIASPDELADQEQTIPPMMCACVGYKDESNTNNE